MRYSGTKKRRSRGRTAETAVMRSSARSLKDFQLSRAKVMSMRCSGGEGYRFTILQSGRGCLDLETFPQERTVHRPPFVQEWASPIHPPRRAPPCSSFSSPASPAEANPSRSDSSKTAAATAWTTSPRRFLLPVAHRLGSLGEERAAVAIDGRSIATMKEVSESLAKLREEGFDVRVLFLTASTDELIKRFSETRRRHPFSIRAEHRRGRRSRFAKRWNWRPSFFSRWPNTASSWTRRGSSPRSFAAGCSSSRESRAPA